MVVAPKGGANEEEHRRDGNKQIPPEEGGEAGFAVRLRSMIALHVVLVDAVVLQIREDAIHQAHPERALAERGQRERTQRELISLPRHAHRLHRTAGVSKQQDAEADQCTANHDESLNGIRPDHSLHAAEHAIGDDGDTGEDDDHAYVPPEQKVHRQRQQIDNSADAGNLREQVAGRRIPARPEAETLLQERVGRNAGLLPVERHKPPCCHPRRHRYGQAEHKGIPVRVVGLAGIAEVADAAHIGREDAHADHPTRQAASCRCEVVGRRLPTIERCPEQHDATGENEEDNQVDNIHIKRKSPL